MERPVYLPYTFRMSNGFRYEVFIGASAGFVEGNRLALDWNWRKLSGREVVAHGAGYESMRECYGALNRYKAEFGDAPVSINLRYGAADADGPPPAERN